MNKTDEDTFQCNCYEFIDTCMVRYGRFGKVYIIGIGNKYNVLNEDKKVILPDWYEGIEVYSNNQDEKIRLIVWDGNKCDDIEY